MGDAPIMEVPGSVGAEFGAVAGVDALKEPDDRGSKGAQIFQVVMDDLVDLSILDLPIHVDE